MPCVGEHYLSDGQVWITVLMMFNAIIISLLEKRLLLH